MLAQLAHLSATDVDLALVQGQHPEDGVEELTLAVAGHAGDAHQLARLHQEGDVVDLRAPVD